MSWIRNLKMKMTARQRIKSYLAVLLLASSFYFFIIQVYLNSYTEVTLPDELTTQYRTDDKTRRRVYEILYLGAPEYVREATSNCTCEHGGEFCSLLSCKNLLEQSISATNLI